MTVDYLMPVPGQPGLYEQELVIRVWAGAEAPGEFKALSNHGGDEDWIAYVPKRYLDANYGCEPSWIMHLGVCDVSRHEVSHGLVFIGAHA